MESDGERKKQEKKERENETRRLRDGEKKKADFDLGAKARRAQQMASFFNFLLFLNCVIYYIF